jgi:hypothetical protein
MATTKTMMVIATPRCPECGESGVLQVSGEGWDAWQEGAPIQDAFGELDRGTREQLKTGYHPACWDASFGELPGAY